MDPPAASGPHEHGRHRPSRSLDHDERAEYERLRRTLGMRNRRLRLWGASLLLLLAVLMAPISVVATWVNSEVTDTDRYEQTVSPIARDPAVQDLIIDRVTDGLVHKIDVRDITDTLADTLDDQNAPRFVVDAARSLDEELKGGLKAGVRYTVARVVTSDAFAKAWDSIHRGAHTAATNVLTGEGGGALEVKGDTITLNVGTVIEEVQKQLIGVTLVGAEDIPGADKSIVLVHNDHLSEARDAARWLGVVGPWLPVVVVVLAGLGIWAAPSHRVALMAAGIGIGAMMCGLLIGLAVVRQIYLDAVPPAAQSQDAAAALYDTLVRFLRQTILTVLLSALLTVTAGYLYGHGRGAAAVRAAAARHTRTAGHALARTGLKPGAAGQWLRTHRPLTTGVVVGAGILTLFLWNYPTPTSVVLVFLLVVVVLAALGVLAAADGAEQR
ncbi:hypothetical protein OHB05_00220 [Streptomyces sp. NBC_00638]|uniref:hypothetical protein n=1 Tax=unclassified Streptomyces TaxID=2593676 RepID=UPI0022504C21|nr:hypothetical protein [Streptomyces sp. NBC_00638]MCX5001056.1 hypothetical protein [Streptomyces sp. NBC_00638]